MDARRYRLWLLLCETVDGSTRYAIDSVASLEPLLGPEVAAAFRDRRIKFCRLWRPKLKARRRRSHPMLWLLGLGVGCLCGGGVGGLCQCHDLGVFEL